MDGQTPLSGRGWEPTTFRPPSAQDLQALILGLGKHQGNWGTDGGPYLPQSDSPVPSLSGTRSNWFLHICLGCFNMAHKLS